MEPTLSALAGFAGGVLLFAVCACLRAAGLNPYGRLLGARCWVRPCARDTWRPCVVVAVSWKGAVCVRELRRQDETGYWIQKENVGWRVRLDEPEDVSVEKEGL